jgi:hypothetical protein
MHIVKPSHAVPSAMHCPPTQQAFAVPEQSLFAQQTAPAVPQAATAPDEQTPPVMAWPEPTQVGVAWLVSQQPPFVQRLPAQQGWPGGHTSQEPDESQVPPFEQVAVALTQVPLGPAPVSQQPLVQESPGQQGWSGPPHWAQ